jgi:hypothetical protein
MSDVESGTGLSSHVLVPKAHVTADEYDVLTRRGSLYR